VSFRCLSKVLQLKLTHFDQFSVFAYSATPQTDPFWLISGVCVSIVPFTQTNPFWWISSVCWYCHTSSWPILVNFRCLLIVQHLTLVNSATLEEIRLFLTKSNNDGIYPKLLMLSSKVGIISMFLSKFVKALVCGFKPEAYCEWKPQSLSSTPLHKSMLSKSAYFRFYLPQIIMIWGG